jgi:hypothetical protein
VQIRAFDAQHPRGAGDVPVSLLQCLADAIAFGGVADLVQA